jgi:hypothetical protein
MVCGYLFYVKIANFGFFKNKKLKELVGFG